jgi:hypothetical protein
MEFTTLAYHYGSAAILCTNCNLSHCNGEGLPSDLLPRIDRLTREQSQNIALRFSLLATVLFVVVGSSLVRFMSHIVKI